MVYFFFFQAEDGIRDTSVTGVQTCALPILAGQVWMWSTPEYGIPAAPKVTDVEIAQARNLDADCLAVRQNWTDLYACHGAQDDRPLDLRPGWLLSAPGI